MASDDEKLTISRDDLRYVAGKLRDLRRPAERGHFALTSEFNAENVVEIAKSQFPRLEAEVAIQIEREKTRRLLIVIAAISLMAGATLVIFAPDGREGVSYAIAGLLALLPLGAIGIQEFRIRTLGINLDAGETAVSADAVKNVGSATPAEARLNKTVEKDTRPSKLDY